ncbi:hypothetical protein HY496_03120, partial [Candidatus Woesearchaeota archaeon]|nr:hypothetical protein [Candidatus Woesearchaeota archaeon]
MTTHRLIGIVLTLMLCLSTIPFTTAGNVSVYAYWIGANAQTLSVTQGDVPQVMITADNLAPSFNVHVQLLKGTQTINTILKVDNLTQDSYTKTVSINTAALSGDYIVKVSVSSNNSTDTETLSLAVKEKEPILPVIEPRNHVPVLHPIGNKVIEIGQILAFTISATDADGDLIEYSAAPFQTNMKLNSISGTFTWKPAQIGDYSITFTATDGEAKDSETIIITVKEATEVEVVPEPVPPKPNTAPQLNSLPPYHVNEGDSITFKVSGTDAEQDTLTYYVQPYIPGPVGENPELFPVIIPTGAHFNTNSGILTFNPGYDFITHPHDEKTVTLYFKAYDGKTFSSWKYAKITVKDVNQKPKFHAIPDQEVYAGETVSFVVYAADKDSEDKLSFSFASDAPAGVTMVNEDSTITAKTPENDLSKKFVWKTENRDIGTHLVKIRAVDGLSLVEEEVKITVKEQKKTDGEETKTQCSDTLDNDGDKLVDLNDPGCTSPEDDDETNTIAPPPEPEQNHAPVIFLNALPAGKEGQMLEFTASITDSDGDTITLTPFSKDQILQHLAPINGKGVAVIDNKDGTFTLQLQPLFTFVQHPQTSKTFTLLLVASDGKTISTLEAQITIHDTNQKPKFEPMGDKNVFVGEKISFTVKAHDADIEDGLNYDLKNIPVGAMFTKSGFSWTPTKDQVGKHTITFTVDDAIDTVSQPVMITVVEKEVVPPPPPPAQCADGKDNDNDGLIDLADPGCASPQDNDETNVVVPPPPPPPPPAQCADG